MLGFNFEEEKIKQEIAKRRAKRVLLQLPEGLKPQGPRLAEVVSAAGALPIISADPCYGACDLAISEAEALGADLIVHFGHAQFVQPGAIPTLYVEARAEVNVDTAILQALQLLHDYVKVGLAASVQHVQMLGRVGEILSMAGKVVLVGNHGQLPYAGQVVGCNYSNVAAVADDAEAFLFVGGGMFHALGIALSTSKPTIVADPYDNRAFSVNEEAQKTLRQQWASVQEAQEARVFGVFVGLKPGQRHIDKAVAAEELAIKHGKSAVLLAAREITPETILEFPTIDAYINTACPRVSLEAPQKFSKPILTVNEFKVAVGEESWDDMLRKGLFES
jgi:2-(3-amino-3-carboxypropyl)histidine synthase